MSRDDQDAIEPDQFDGAPHPRDRFAFFGHQDAEEAFLEGLRTGRLHHAWLIGGPNGIGKATLAYRVARALLNFTSGSGSEISDLTVSPDAPAARQVAALSHPNLAVLRRAPGTDKKA